jgi:hypothetical protein
MPRAQLPNALTVKDGPTIFGTASGEKTGIAYRTFPSRSMSFISAIGVALALGGHLWPQGSSRNVLRPELPEPERVLRCQLNALRLRFSPADLLHVLD